MILENRQRIRGFIVTESNQRSREFEMSDVLSEVYDILHPSPIALRELSAIAVAIQLWRLDLNQHRSSNTLESFCRDGEPNWGFTLKHIIRNISPAIDNIPKKYAKALASSTFYWLQYHYFRIFEFYRDTRSSILNDFDDIVCDNDGAIHYVRTAERMLRCNWISLLEKFEIACTYCFEDSIRQMWPPVRGKIKLSEINFNQRPYLYYWVCYLENELDKVPSYDDDCSVDELMLSKCTSENRSSFEYFWNRSSSEGRYRKAEISSGLEICLILPKLNEPQLMNLVTEKGDDWVYYAWCNTQVGDHALPIWMYTKDLMSKTNFTKLIEKMLYVETNNYYAVPRENGEYSQTIRELAICCKIWNSARTNLKRSAIEVILPRVALFKKHELDPSMPRATLFLQTVLQDATLEEKKLFWYRNWFNFLISTCFSDFNRLMKLCLEDEYEIDRFRANVNALINYDDLNNTVSMYLEKGHAKELIHVLNFCSPDAKSRIDLKRRLLRENFLGEHSVLCIGILCKLESLRELINDAYTDDVELVTDFCKQLISSRGTMNQLLGCIRNGYFWRVIQFFEFFAFTGLNVDQIKGRFVDELMEYLHLGEVWQIDSQSLQAFLLWCLGSDDRVIEFKQTISPAQVLRKMVQNQILSDQDDGVPSTSTKLIRYPRNLDAFLSWYFNTPEKIKEFKVEMIDVFNTLPFPKRGY